MLQNRVNDQHLNFPDATKRVRLKLICMIISASTTLVYSLHKLHLTALVHT